MVELSSPCSVEEGRFILMPMSPNRHAIMVIIHHMPKHGTSYRDLGPDYFDKLDE